MIRADLGLTRVYRTRRRPARPRAWPRGARPTRRGSGRSAGQADPLRGVIVRRLDPESADLIVAIDGKPVKSVDDLLTEVEAHAPGDVVIVTVLRGGREVEVPVRLGQS